VNSYDARVSDHKSRWESHYEAAKANKLRYFPTATVGWNGTQWYGKAGGVYRNSTPEGLAKMFSKARHFIMTRSISPKLVMIEAWNE
jgi:hypothetical protein